MGWIGLPGLGCPEQPPKPYPTKQTQPRTGHPTPNPTYLKLTKPVLGLSLVGFEWVGLCCIAGWLGLVGIGCVGGQIGSAPLNSRQPTPSQNKRGLVDGPIKGFGELGCVGFGFGCEGSGWVGLLVMGWSGRGLVNGELGG